MNRDLLVRRLRGDDPEKALDAAEALGRLGPAAAPALTSALDDARPGVRAAALGGLGLLTRPDEAIIAAVIGRLEDPDLAVRRRACEALWRFRPSSQAALEALAVALASDDPGLIVGAAHALHEIGPEARGAAAGLAAAALADAIRRFRDHDSFAAFEAAQALAAIAVPDEGHVPALLGLLEVERSVFVQAAAKALGGYGPKALAAVPKLRRLLDDERPNVRMSAAFALARITDDDGPVEALIGMAGEGEYDSRLLALVYLAALGARAARALPRLRSLLEEPDPGIREGAAAAIEGIGRDAPGSSP